MVLISTACFNLKISASTNCERARPFFVGGGGWERWRWPVENGAHEGPSLPSSPKWHLFVRHKHRVWRFFHLPVTPPKTPSRTHLKDTVAVTSDILRDTSAVTPKILAVSPNKLAVTPKNSAVTPSTISGHTSKSGGHTSKSGGHNKATQARTTETAATPPPTAATVATERYKEQHVQQQQPLHLSPSLLVRGKSDDNDTYSGHNSYVRSSSALQICFRTDSPPVTSTAEHVSKLHAG